MVPQFTSPSSALPSLATHLSMRKRTAGRRSPGCSEAGRKTTNRSCRDDRVNAVIGSITRPGRRSRRPWLLLKPDVFMTRPGRTMDSSGRANTSERPSAWRADFRMSARWACQTSRVAATGNGKLGSPPDASGRHGARHAPETIVQIRDRPVVRRRLMDWPPYQVSILASTRPVPPSTRRKSLRDGSKTANPSGVLTRYNFDSCCKGHLTQTGSTAQGADGPRVARVARQPGRAAARGRPEPHRHLASLRDPVCEQTGPPAVRRRLVAGPGRSGAAP